MRRLGVLTAVSLASLSCASGTPPPLLTVTAWPSGQPRSTFAGRAANFSALPIPSGTFLAQVPSTDHNGCEEYKLPASSVAAVVLVSGGGCSFLRKAELAQSAGARGVVVLSEEGLVLMTAGKDKSVVDLQIFALCMKAADGEPLVERLSQGSEPVPMAFEVYKHQTRGISLALVICGATALEVLGAYFSTIDLRRPFKVTVKGPQVVHTAGNVGNIYQPEGPPSSVLQGGAMSGADGALFCVAGSCMLVAMYFFMKYMIYGIIAVFCVVGFCSLTVMGSWALTKLCPSLGQPLCCQIINMADLICAALALTVVLSWLQLQNTSWGWMLQDLIGFGFLMLVQQALQLPNLKVATMVLSVMFCFDIFWVFISPLLFGQSVMVKAATSPVKGLTVPMLLRVPSFTDPFGRDRMLGFGDIAAPGLLISYLLRWDTWNGRGCISGYFWPAVAGYLLGLSATVAAVLLMHMAQPALLYLVPGTLGLTLILSSCRGDLWSLWQGPPQEDYPKNWIDQGQGNLPPHFIHAAPQLRYMGVPEEYYCCGCLRLPSRQGARPRWRWTLGL